MILCGYVAFEVTEATLLIYQHVTHMTYAVKQNSWKSNSRSACQKILNYL
jgi:hypothetical protein